MGDKGDSIILVGSEKTALTYRIDGGMDDRDRDEYESMDSGYVLGRNWPSMVSDSIDLRHRMDYLRKRNLGFTFLRITDPSFENELLCVNPQLPHTLAYMVADFYRNGTSRISDLIENVSRKNPAGFKEIAEYRPYEIMIGNFLKTLDDGNNDLGVLLENCFFDRIPADKFGCSSIRGSKRTGFETELVLQIVLKA